MKSIEEKVGIGVVTFNRLDLLQKCLPSWIESNCPVVIWDNGSGPEVIVWLSKYQVKLLRSPANQGVAVGRNRLVDYFRDNHPNVEYLLLPDSDVQLLPGCITAMVEKIKSNPEYGFVAWPQANQGFPVGADGMVEETASECQLSRMETWREIGRYPETLVYYSLDSWMATIANMLGWKTALVLGKGEGYIHYKHGSQANPGVKKQISRDVALWQRKEGKMIEYWTQRFKYGKGALQSIISEQDVLTALASAKESELTAPQKAPLPRPFSKILQLGSHLMGEWQRAIADEPEARAQWKPGGGQWSWCKDGIALISHCHEWCNVEWTIFDANTPTELSKFFVEITVTGRADAAGFSFGDYKDFLAKLEPGNDRKRLQLELDIPGGTWTFRVNGELQQPDQFNSAVHGIQDLLNGAFRLKGHWAQEVYFQDFSIRTSP